MFILFENILFFDHRSHRGPSFLQSDFRGAPTVSAPRRHREPPAEQLGLVEVGTAGARAAAKRLVESVEQHGLGCLNADFGNQGVIFSMFRDLQDLHSFAPLVTQFFKTFCQHVAGI